MTLRPYRWMNTVAMPVSRGWTNSEPNVETLWAWMLVGVSGSLRADAWISHSPSWVPATMPRAFGIAHRMVLILSALNTAETALSSATAPSGAVGEKLNVSFDLEPSILFGCAPNSQKRPWW